MQAIAPFSRTTANVRDQSCGSRMRTQRGVNVGAERETRLHAVRSSAAIPAASNFVRPCEVDESALDMGADEVHGDSITDIEILEAAHECSFHGQPEHAHPCAFVGWTRHDGVKPFSDPRHQAKRSRRLGHLSLDLGCIALLLGAVESESRKFVAAVPRGLTQKLGFQKARRDEIRVTPVGCPPRASACRCSADYAEDALTDVMARPVSTAPSTTRTRCDPPSSINGMAPGSTGDPSISALATPAQRRSGFSTKIE